MKALGLFGGTFNPVHRGHLELARHALNYCRLSEIVFIPAAVPPHKTKNTIVSFTHRVEMLKLAIGKEKNFSVSTVEKNLSYPNFTIDTLDQLTKNKNSFKEFFFIIGLDAFLEIHTWKDSEKVLNSVNFIVAARQGYSADKYYSYIGSLRYTKSDSFWYNAVTGKKIIYLDIEVPGISSSDVRNSIKQKKILTDLVNSKVLQYILKHQLYT